MKLKTLLIVALALCLPVSVALADLTVVGTGTNAFQSFTTGDLGSTGNPYWNNSSSDNDDRNIGFILTGTNTAPPTAVDYLGTNPTYWGQSIGSGGAADPAFYMSNTPNTPSAVSNFLVTITAYETKETFGIYDKDNLNSLIPIFGPGAPGGNTVGSTFTVALPANFGFYFDSTGNPGGSLYYSEAALGSNDGLQHFAMFQGDNYPTAFFLGMEDLMAGGTGPVSDFDYNDMVVKFQAVPVPPSALLLGSGLLGMGLLRFRRKNRG